MKHLLAASLVGVLASCAPAPAKPTMPPVYEVVITSLIPVVSASPLPVSSSSAEIADVVEDQVGSEGQSRTELSQEIGQKYFGFIGIGESSPNKNPAPIRAWKPKRQFPDNDPLASIEELNIYRSIVGLSPVGVHQGTTFHDDFIMMMDPELRALVQETAQTPNCSHYATRGGMMSNLYCGGVFNHRSAVREWIDDSNNLVNDGLPGHRLWMFNPHLLRTAYASDKISAIAVFDTSNTTAFEHAFTYPVHGQHMDYAPKQFTIHLPIFCEYSNKPHITVSLNDAVETVLDVTQNNKVYGLHSAWSAYQLPEYDDEHDADSAQLSLASPHVAGRIYTSPISQRERSMSCGRYMIKIDGTLHYILKKGEEFNERHQSICADNSSTRYVTFFAGCGCTG